MNKLKKYFDITGATVSTTAKELGYSHTYVRELRNEYKPMTKRHNEAINTYIDGKIDHSLEADIYFYEKLHLIFHIPLSTQAQRIGINVGKFRRVVNEKTKAFLNIESRLRVYYSELITELIELKKHPQ